MATELKIGSVTVKLADVKKLPEGSGQLTTEQVQALPKAPRNISGYCDVA